MSDKKKVEKITAAKENFFNSDILVSPLCYAVNIHEHDRKYQLIIAAPGFKKDNFKVTTEGNTLTITAETTHKKVDTDFDYTRREFSMSSFARAFCLPENVITDHVSSRYHNGMLILNIKKNERFLHGKKNVRTES